MPTDRPPPRSSRRTAAAPPKIPTGPRIAPMAPYVVALGLIAGLVYLVRQPRFATPAGMAMGVVVTLGLGWVALSSRHHLPPEDKLRSVLPLVAVLAAAAALAPLALTLYPSAPAGEVTLSAPGDTGAVQVRGVAANVWVTVHGGIVATANGAPNYFLTARHDDSSQRIDGTLHPHAGGPRPEQHVLAAHGPGTYAFRLEGNDPGVALPLRVSVRTKPFSTLLLGLAFGALAAVIIAADVMLRRRGLEPTFAAALMLPLAAVVYLQRQPLTDALPSELLAAGLVGVLVGGAGGEVLARAINSLMPSR